LTLQVAFTFIGTIVGAGFASGREILQFFTQYGSIAILTISVATLILVWLGIALMLRTHEQQVSSYDELNIAWLGPKNGHVINICTSFMLLGTMCVILAGAGTLLHQQLAIPYPLGLFLSTLCIYLVLHYGIRAIVSVNMIVVPIMLFFCMMLSWITWSDVQLTPWTTPVNSVSWFDMLIAPWLYAAFNLCMAQAILVPLSYRINNRRILFTGGLLGGLGIGLLLFLLHLVLYSQLTSIRDTEIPIAQIMYRLAHDWQPLFVFVLFSEMFTTLCANGYGLAHLLHQHIRLPRAQLLVTMLSIVFIISLFGFKDLLTYLYPLFGCLSIWWIWLVFLRSRPPRLDHPHHK
jgi:uncharacterized membrane protein YkvI